MTADSRKVTLRMGAGFIASCKSLQSAKTEASTSR